MSITDNTNQVQSSINGSNLRISGTFDITVEGLSDIFSRLFPLITSDTGNSNGTPTLPTPAQQSSRASVRSNTPSNHSRGTSPAPSSRSAPVSSSRYATSNNNDNDDDDGDQPPF